jgi:hypothetical protein
MVKEFNSLDVRPYQLMCVVCRLGSDGRDEYYFAERLDAIGAAVRGDPVLPVTLRLNVDTDYAYQNPGREYDTPEGDLFNDKRDLDVTQRLGLVPGATRPALEMFGRVFRNVPACRGICAYNEVTAEGWRGCRLADSGNYERGHALGLEAVIVPRSEDEKARAKRESAAAIYSADVLEIRPHHLMCMTCFHDGKKELSPIEEDNLFEAIDVIQKNPDVPVRLVAGPCVICTPCSEYLPSADQCVSANGRALRDQKKDLDVLGLLGLEYGAELPARRLLEMLYKKIRSTRQVCGYVDGEVRAPEWSICGGPEGSAHYARGRAAGLGVEGVAAPADDEKS